MLEIGIFEPKSSLGHSVREENLSSSIKVNDFFVIFLCYKSTQFPFQLSLIFRHTFKPFSIALKFLERQ